MSKACGGRRVWLVAAALSLVPTVAFAGAAAGSVGEPSTLEFSSNVRVYPHGLSETEMTPAALRTKIEVANIIGTHPLALDELSLQLDRDLTISTAGIPKCRRGLGAFAWYSIKDRCQGAIVGHGHAEIAIIFAGEKTIPVESELIVVNGGIEAGTTTLHALFYLAIPVPAVVSLPVEFRRSADGRYGSTATVTIPKIVGGAGSITSLVMTINKKYLLDGRRVGVVSARCKRGSLGANLTASFRDGEVRTERFLRTCRSI